MLLSPPAVVQKGQDDGWVFVLSFLAGFTMALFESTPGVQEPVGAVMILYLHSTALMAK